MVYRYAILLHFLVTKITEILYLCGQRDNKNGFPACIFFQYASIVVFGGI